MLIEEVTTDEVKDKDNRERFEKRIFKISFWTGVFFVLLEFVMAVMSKSQAILVDTAFDAAELIVIGASLALTPLFYKPISERRPFGYFQCESLFIIIKGFMLISVTVSLMMGNIQMILSGGNHVDSNQVAVMEMLLTVLSFLVLMTLRHYNKMVKSPLADAEVYGWKVDFIGGFSLSVAFLVPLLLKDTALAWIIPYFDQLVAIALAVVMLPEPVKMVITAFKNLILFSPDRDITEGINHRVTEVLKEFNYLPEFIDITQTGRRIWVAVTFKVQEEALRLEELRLAHERISAELLKEQEGITVELIPVWKDYEATE